VSREEKVEYRDQDGNLLDEEQVKALEGKEIPQPEEAGVAPPHPDVEGVARETVGIPESKVQGKPVAQKEVKADESKEESIARSDKGVAKPASEGNEATSS
jgi:dolichyl-phosphate-mannose-protein mannosyltransferase